MANVVNKLLNMLNMNTESSDEEDYVEEPEYYEEEQEDESETKGIFGRKATRTTSNSQSVKMVILQPTSFEEAEEVCDLLRERKSIIINLESVNKDIARRLIDVVSGAVHVLDGHMQKISNSIFLIAPYNYDISNDTKDDSRNKINVSSWLKNS